MLWWFPRRWTKPCYVEGTFRRLEPVLKALGPSPFRGVQLSVQQHVVCLEWFGGLWWFPHVRVCVTLWHHVRECPGAGRGSNPIMPLCWCGHAYSTAAVAQMKRKSYPSTSVIATKRQWPFKSLPLEQWSKWKDCYKNQVKKENQVIDR